MRIMSCIIVVTIGFYALLCYYIILCTPRLLNRYDRIFIFSPPPRHRQRRRSESIAAASDRRFTTSFIRTLYIISVKNIIYIIKLFNVCSTKYYYYYKCFVSVFRRSRFPPRATRRAITCTHTRT